MFPVHASCPGNFLRLGYNTNGLSHHDPIEALELIADTGFQSVALTIDHGWLSPKDPRTPVQREQIKAKLAELNLSTVIETGARYLLSPRYKHFPSLMDTDPTLAQQRIDFLKYCIDTAVILESDCVSIWSGKKPVELDFQEAMDRLAKSLETVVRYAEDQNIMVGFEPEPGMLVDTTGRFERLLHLFDSDNLKMTMDIGHLFCLSEVPIAGFIEKWADRLINVHIEDMQAGVHEHLMFGEGQIHFPPVIESLVRVGYSGGLHVELSRHSYNAAEIIQQSFDFLNPIVVDAMSSM